MGERQANFKRRRLDEATSALARPFKSPLRKDGDGVVYRDPSVKNDKEGSMSEVGKSFRHITSKEAMAHKPVLSSAPPRYYITPRQYRTPLKMDPELVALQKEQISLQSRLATLRSQLDTAQQALRIESSPRDEELQALTEKWKKVSQNVADELFVSAKDRIERMGGVDAWKEKERMRKVQMSWDDEEGREIEASDDFEGTPGVEVTSSSSTTTKEDENASISLKNSLHWLMISGPGIYNGHDARKFEYRPGLHRL